MELADSVLAHLESDLGVDIGIFSRRLAHRLPCLPNGLFCTTMRYSRSLVVTFELGMPAQSDKKIRLTAFVNLYIWQARFCL